VERLFPSNKWLLECQPQVIVGSGKKTYVGFGSKADIRVFVALSSSAFAQNGQKIQTVLRRSLREVLPKISK
jgi:hypothetical protein